MARLEVVALLRAIGLGLFSVTLSWQAQQTGVPERWRLVEIWRSGGDTTLSLSFEQVVDLELAPNGQLLVLTRGRTPQLVWIDNTGRPVRSVGGAGATAPRFDAPNGVTQFPDGRIVINDPRVGRFSVVSETGRFIRDVDYQPWGWSAQWMGFVAADGALLDFIADGARLTWRRWAPDFSASRLVPASPCDVGAFTANPDASFRIDGAAGGIAVPVPFLQPPVAFVRAPDGSSWSGVGPDYRRIVHAAWGSCDDGAVVEIGGDPLPVPDDMRAAEEQRIRQMAVDVRAPVLPDVGRIPTTMPLFHALRIDRQHRLWVERPVTPTTRAFSVFERDGRHRADVASIPAPIDTDRPVTFSDNHIFYFTTDDSGWTWLVAMRIERVG